MHPSRYLKIFPYPDNLSYLLLYSTKNAAMALVPAEDGLRIQQGEIPPDYEETLSELGMAVVDPDKEQQETLAMMDEINRLDVGLNVSIILGMACNFSCIYCYEGSMKDGRAMAQDTVNLLISFLKERYVIRNRERLTLDFYGGEPLLYPGIIQNIARPLKKFVEDRGGKFHFSLVTNGSLLTREMVQKLLPAGLYAAKVTVDGPADEHNLLRPFSSGKPSFETILTNIASCCDLIKIGFGGNYTGENYTRIPELLESLDQYGLSKENLSTVQFHPVMQTTDQYSNPEFTGGCLSVDEQWIAKASIAVRREVLKRGFRTPKLSPSPCMVDIEDAFVINYNGSLHKCVAMIGHPAYAVGDVRNGFFEYHRTYNLVNWQNNTECLECEYLPLCFGGCRHMEFQRTGTMDGVNCMRTYYNRVLKDIIQQDAVYQAESDETVD